MMEERESSPGYQIGPYNRVCLSCCRRWQVGEANKARPGVPPMMNVTVEFSFCKSCNDKKTEQGLRHEAEVNDFGTFGSLYRPGKGSISVSRKETAEMKAAMKRDDDLKQAFKIDELNF